MDVMAMQTISRLSVIAIIGVERMKVERIYRRKNILFAQNRVQCIYFA
jgi:hypothetical protein